MEMAMYMHDDDMDQIPNGLNRCVMIDHPRLRSIAARVPYNALELAGCHLLTSHPRTEMAHRDRPRGPVLHSKASHHALRRVFSVAIQAYTTNRSRASSTSSYIDDHDQVPIGQMETSYILDVKFLKGVQG
jgi:hypothetical protein